ncbi:ig-like domain-containing protein [Caerostris extrusa]|uniref:Ig-like domain-containing protein n=1 Tax=Caerostris extrusa TaxID=172846 RepID=A0AAV4SLW7_CAEEX|nr:ig-like domain-containing protein [Caerostris extrusa]
MANINRNHHDIWFSYTVQGVSSLQIKALQVPESIEAGQVVRLVCLFDPEQEDLYSVKWYKDDIEFFRFLPKDKPANQFFEIRDVEVDMSRSSNGTVFLKNTSRSAEGMYRCEVSADAPSFQSIFSEKFMAVEGKYFLHLSLWNLFSNCLVANISNCIKLR